MAKIELVVWLPGMNPYWAERLSQLARADVLRFEVWLNSPVDPGRLWNIEHLNFPVRMLGQQYSRPQLPPSINIRTLLTLHFAPGTAFHAAFHASSTRVAYYAEKTFDSWVRRSQPKTAMRRTLFRHAELLLTPGPDADEYCLSSGARAQSLRRLEHAVLPVVPGNSPFAWDPADTSPMALFCGRLESGKGVDVLEAIVRTHIARGREGRFGILGSGSKYGVIGKLANEFPRQVQLRPWSEPAGVAAAMTAADVLLFPSLGDPYGLVIDESMVYGCRIISAASVGEVSWRLQEGRGCVLDDHDPERWSNCLADLRANPADTGPTRGQQFMAGRTPERWVDQLLLALA